jgi:hypothetical protein
MENERVIIRESLKVTPQFYGEASINVEEPLKN